MRLKTYGHGMGRGCELSKRGLSLVEIMVAIAILFITVAGTAAGQVTARRLAATSAETGTAMADLQACMEQVLLMSPTDIPVAGSPFEAGLPVNDYAGLHLDAEQIVASYPGYAGGDVPDPLEVQLTITFRDHQGRVRSMRLSSMKTR